MKTTLLMILSALFSVFLVSACGSATTGSNVASSDSNSFKSSFFGGSYTGYYVLAQIDCYNQDDTLNATSTFDDASVKETLTVSKKGVLIEDKSSDCKAKTLMGVVFDSKNHQATLNNITRSTSTGKDCNFTRTLVHQSGKTMDPVIAQFTISNTSLSDRKSYFMVYPPSLTFPHGAIALSNHYTTGTASDFCVSVYKRGHRFQ